MKNIPINLNKTGLDYLIEQLRTDIAALSWISSTFPAAKPGIKDKLIYPEIYCNDGTGESFPIIPDNSEKAFVFFEKNPSTYNIDSGIDNRFSLNLICWYNLKAIRTENYDFSEELIRTIISILEVYQVENVQVNYNYLFENYSLIKREHKQLLMFPYGAFKLSFNILGC
jgi:hypothetical protein